MGAGLDTELRAASLEPVHAPFIEFDMSPSPTLRMAVEDLATGVYDWLVVSSARTVAVLQAVDGFRVPTSTRVAAVGPASAEALADAGVRVDLVPPLGTADSLVGSFPFNASPAARRNVLFPASREASSTISHGLRNAGYTVERIDAYRPRPATVDQEVLEDLRSGAFAGAILTSPMIAHLVLRAGAPESMALVAIGPPTARACESEGRPADAISAEPTSRALVSALRRVLGRA